MGSVGAGLGFFVPVAGFMSLKVEVLEELRFCGAAEEVEIFFWLFNLDLSSPAALVIPSGLDFFDAKACR
jgi:hypothetical protein